jgi:hypothetical protein
MQEFTLEEETDPEVLKAVSLQVQPTAAPAPAPVAQPSEVLFEEETNPEVLKAVSSLVRPVAAPAAVAQPTTAPKRSLGPQLAETLKQTGLYPLATSAIATGKYNDIRRKESGDWELPFMAATTKEGGVKEQFVTVGAALEQTFGGKLRDTWMTDSQPVQKVFHDFQQANNLSDEEMNGAWNDFWRMTKAWDKDEKVRLFSDGRIRLNPMSTDYFDDQKVQETLDKSGVSEAAKQEFKAGLRENRYQTAAEKIFAYETAMGVLSSPTRKQSSWGIDDSTAVGAFLTMGEIPTPSKYAEQKGYSAAVLNTPEFLREYETQVIDKQGAAGKWARGLATDAVLSFNKIATTGLGIGGLAGSESMAQAAAAGSEAGGIVSQGKTDTGIAGAIVQELPSVAAQIVASQLTGGLSLVATGGRAAGAIGLTTTLATAGAQSAGMTYADQRARGATDDEARSKAVKAGLNTAVITGIFQGLGAGGVERVASVAKPAASITLRDVMSAGTRQEVWTATRKFVKQVMFDTLGEASEEAIDAFTSSFLLANPDTDLGTLWSDTWEVAKVGGALGGGVGVASRGIEKSAPLLTPAVQQTAPQAAQAAMNTPITGFEPLQGQAGVIGLDGKPIPMGGTAPQAAQAAQATPAQATPAQATPAQAAPAPVEAAIPEIQKVENKGRAKMAERILASAGVDPESASVLGQRLAQSVDPDGSMETEAFRQGVLAEFSAQGGSSEADVQIFSEIPESYAGTDQYGRTPEEQAAYAAELNEQTRQERLRVNRTLAQAPAETAPAAPAPAAPAWMQADVESVMQSVPDATKSQVEALAAERKTTAQIAQELNVDPAIIGLLKIGLGIPSWTTATTKGGAAVEDLAFTAWRTDYLKKSQQPDNQPQYQPTGLSAVSQEERMSLIGELLAIKPKIEIGVKNPDPKDVQKAVDVAQKLSGYTDLEFVRANVSDVFRSKSTGEFIKITFNPTDEYFNDVKKQMEVLQNGGQKFATLPEYEVIIQDPDGGNVVLIKQKPVGIEGANIENRTKNDNLLFEKLKSQNPLAGDEKALRVETDQSLKNLGLVVGADGNVRAFAFDFDGISGVTESDIAQAIDVLKTTPEMAGVPLSEFSKDVQDQILKGQFNPAVTPTPAAQATPAPAQATPAAPAAPAPAQATPAAPAAPAPAQATPAPAQATPAPAQAPTLSREELKATFDLSDEQAEVAESIARAMGLTAEQVLLAREKAAPTQQPTPTTDATTTGNVQPNNQPQYQPTGQGGQTAEAGSGNRPVESTPTGVPQAETPPAGTGTVTPEPTPEPARLTYDEFKTQYEKAFNNMNRYTLDEAGSGVYLEEMAKLADAYPDFLTQFEGEQEAELPPTPEPAPTPAPEPAPAPAPRRRVGGALTQGRVGTTPVGDRLRARAVTPAVETPTPTPTPEQMTPEEYAAMKTGRAERNPDRRINNYTQTDTAWDNAISEHEDLSIAAAEAGLPALPQNKPKRLRTPQEQLEIDQIRDAGNPQAGSPGMLKVNRDDHAQEVAFGVKSSLPVSAEAVDTYGITLPEGYVKQNGLYVYQPQSAADGSGVGELVTGQPVGSPDGGMTEEGYEIAKDVASLRREQGKPNLKLEAQIAAYEAKQRGEQVNAGEIFSDIVAGHPQAEVFDARLTGAVPIKVRSLETAERKLFQIQKLKGDLVQKLGIWNYRNSKAKTKAEKSKLEKEYPKDQRGADQRLVDAIAVETEPALIKLVKQAEELGLPKTDAELTPAPTPAPIKLKGTSSKARRAAEDIRETLGVPLDPDFEKEIELDNGVTVEIDSFGDFVTLTGLKTPKESRGKGRATQALKEIVSLADDAGVPIRIVAEPFGTDGMNKAQLIDWYSKNGFALQADGETMIYTPAVRFSVDDKLIMRSTFTNEDAEVSFRGYEGDKAMVWTGRTQMAVPVEWLRRPTDPAPAATTESTPTPAPAPVEAPTAPEVKLTPIEKRALAISKLKGTELRANGITYVPESVMTLERRKSLLTEGEKAKPFLPSPRGGPNIEVREWAEVTGDPYARGWAIIDRRKPAPTPEPTPTPTPEPTSTPTPEPTSTPTPEPATKQKIDTFSGEEIASLNEKSLPKGWTAKDPKTLVDPKGKEWTLTRVDETRFTLSDGDASFSFTKPDTEGLPQGRTRADVLTRGASRIGKVIEVNDVSDTAVIEVDGVRATYRSDLKGENWERIEGDVEIQKFRTRTKSRAVQLFEESPLFISLIDGGGVMSMSAAKRIYGTKWYKANKSQWNGSGVLRKNPQFTSFYTQNPNASTPEELADDLYKANAIKGDQPQDLFNAIATEIASARKTAATEKAEAESLSQDEDFARATSDGEYKIILEKLSEGDVLFIDGEEVIVDKIIRNRNGQLIRIDFDGGKRFGSPTVKAEAEFIYVDDYFDNYEFTPDEGIEDEAIYGAAEDFALESVTQDQLGEEAAAQKQRDQLAERQAQRLTGDAGIIVPDMFGPTEGQTPLFNERRDDLRFQRRPQGAKGFAKLLADGKVLLKGLLNPDFTTAVHEMAHAFEMTGYTGLTDEEVATVKTWAGDANPNNRKMMERKASEKFARGWERYLADGKAPFAELQAIFDKMAKWMRETYKTITGSPIDVEISSEVRAIFDKIAARMVAPSTIVTPSGTQMTTEDGSPLPPAIDPASDTPIETMDDLAGVARFHLENPLPPPPALTQREFNTPEDEPIPYSVQRARADMEAALYGYDTAAWNQAAQTFGDLWDRVTNEPAGTGEAELNKLMMSANPDRPLTALEVARFTHEGLKRKMVLDRTLRELQTAISSGNRNMAEEKQNLVNAASARYQTMLNQIARSRTAAGRALNAWKYALKEDFSQGTLYSRALTNYNSVRVAEGKAAVDALPEAEAKAVAQFAERMAKMQEEIDALKEAQQLGVDRAAEQQAMIDALRAERDAAKAKGSTKVQEVTRRVLVDKVRKAAKEARERLGLPPIEDNTRYQMDSANDPTWRDRVIVLAEVLVANPIMSTAQFADRVRVMFGAAYAAVADRLRSDVDEYLRPMMEDVSGTEMPTPQMVMESIDGSEELTNQMVYDLAKAHVYDGARDTEVLDRVYRDLLEFYPSLTREDVAQLFTRYGETRAMNKSEEAKALRAAKSLELVQRQIDDLEARGVMKRTGTKKDDPDVKLRELRKKRDDLAKDLGYAPVDPETQLSSAQTAAKKRMKNEMEELDRAIKSNTPIVRVKRGVRYTEDMEQMRSDLEELRKAYADIFGQQRTPAERMNAVIKDLDRRIAKERELINKGILKEDEMAKPAAVDSPEISARRDLLKDLKRQKEEAYDLANPGKRAAEVAQKEAQRITNSWINKLAASQSDTPTWKSSSKPSAVEELIKSHMESPQPDFAQRLISLGATAEQARILDSEILSEVERRRIVADARNSPAEREARILRDLDRRIGAEMKLIDQGLIKPEKSVAYVIDSPDISARRERLKELKRQKYEAYDALNPNERALNQAMKAAQKALEARQKIINEGLPAAKDKAARDANVVPTAELQALWEAADDMDVLIREMRKNRPLTPAQQLRQLDDAYNTAVRTREVLRKRIADGDLVPASGVKPTVENRTRLVREENAELRKQITQMQRDAGVGVFAYDVREAKKVAALEKSIDELRRKRAVKDFSKRKTTEPVTSERIRTLELIKDNERREYEQERAMAVFKTLGLSSKALEYAMASWHARQLFNLAGDFGVFNRQLGKMQLFALWQDVKAIFRRGRGVKLADDTIIGKTLAKGFEAFMDERVEDRIYAEMATDPSYALKKANGFDLVSPHESSHEISADGRVRVNPMFLFNDRVIASLAIIKGIVKTSAAVALLPTTGGATWKTILKGAGETVVSTALAVGGARFAKRVERANRVIINVARWGLVDAAMKIAGNVDPSVNPDYSRIVTEAMMTYTGKVAGQSGFSKGMKNNSYWLGIIFSFPQYVVTNMQSVVGIPLWSALYQTTLKRPEGQSFRPQAIAAVAALQAQYYLGTSAKILFWAMLLGVWDEEDSETEFGVVLNPKHPYFGCLKLGKTFIDLNPRANKWISDLSRMFGTTKLNERALKDGYLVPDEASSYDKTEMLQKFAYGQINMNWKTLADLSIKGELYQGGELGRMGGLQRTDVILTEIAANLTARDIWKMYKIHGPATGLALSGMIMGGANVSVRETKDEREKRKAEERRRYKPEYQ